MKKTIRVILLVLFAVLFCVSTCVIIVHYREAAKQAAIYDDLADQMAAVRTEPSASETEPTAEETTEETEAPLLPEMAVLYAQNSDLVGWLTIEDTNINYPVVQSLYQANFYLDHNFEKGSSVYGCLYVQEDCDVTLPSDNLIIYGHHMANGSMFQNLEKFRRKDFWAGHKTFTYSTLTEQQEYEILAVFRTVVYTDTPEAFKYYLFTDAADAGEFDAFVAQCKALSFYDTGVTAEYGDKLLTLSTCEYTQENGRLVVVAKRIG